MIKMADIIISLDLSFHASGIAVLNHLDKTVSIGLLTSKHYGYNDRATPKYLKANINSVNIAATLKMNFYKYRHFDVNVIYESMPYKFKRKSTNSDMDLHGMQCHVANTLGHMFKLFPYPHMPKEHKFALTGQHTADKALSIHHMLSIYPNCRGWFQKFDDIADAFAMLTIGYRYCFPEYKIKIFPIKQQFNKF
jgi:hypothetical protein